MAFTGTLRVWPSQGGGSGTTAGRPASDWKLLGKEPVKKGEPERNVETARVAERELAVLANATLKYKANWQNILKIIDGIKGNLHPDDGETIANGLLHSHKYPVYFAGIRMLATLPEGKAPQLHSEAAYKLQNCFREFPEDWVGEAADLVQFIHPRYKKELVEQGMEIWWDPEIRQKITANWKSLPIEALPGLIKAARESELPDIQQLAREMMTEYSKSKDGNEKQA